MSSQVSLWELEGGRTLWAVDSIVPETSSWVVSSDLKLLVFASGWGDSMVWLWRPESQRILHVLKNWPSRIFSLALTPDGKTLACAHRRKAKDGAEVRLINSESGLLLQTTVLPAGALAGQNMDAETPRKLAWFPQKSKFAFVYYRDIFHATDGSARPVSTLATKVSRPIAFSPDGKTLAGKTEAGRIALLETASGKHLRTLDLEEAPIDRLAWSPKGARLACISGRDIRLWDLRTGRLVQVSGGAPRQAKALTWSPNGDILALGGVADSSDSDSGAIHLWDVRAGRSVGTLAGHPSPVRGAAWSSDGKALASISHGLMRVWDLRTAWPRFTLLPIGEADGLALTPEGHFRATEGIDAEEALVYVVQTAAGSETLKPSEFTAKYGWKNDPSKVGQ